MATAACGAQQSRGVTKEDCLETEKRLDLGLGPDGYMPVFSHLYYWLILSLN